MPEVFGVPNELDRPMERNTIPVWRRTFGTWQFSVSRNAMTTQELEQEYDLAASIWQKTISKLGFERAYDQLVRTGIESLLAKDPDKELAVLDIGIGSGAMTAAFASKVAQSTKFFGVDLSGEMLNVARNRLRGIGIDVDLTKSDADALPYADNSFDAVMAAHVFEHTVDPKHAIEEALRVLKPNGVLLACITKQSLMGAYIHLKWRTHRASQNRALDWFRSAGADRVLVQQFTANSWARGFSCGYIVRKPL